MGNRKGEGKAKGRKVQGLPKALGTTNALTWPIIMQTWARQTASNRNYLYVSSRQVYKYIELFSMYIRVRENWRERERERVKATQRVLDTHNKSSIIYGVGANRTTAKFVQIFVSIKVCRKAERVSRGWYDDYKRNCPNGWPRLRFITQCDKERKRGQSISIKEADWPKATCIDESGTQLDGSLPPPSCHPTADCGKIPKLMSNLWHHH